MPQAALDAVLLHELGHVVGLEHIHGTIMAPAIPMNQQAEFGVLEANVIRCMASGYKSRKRGTLAPFKGCVSP